MPAVASGSQLQVALENVQTTIDGGDDYARFNEYAQAVNAYRTAGAQLQAIGLGPASVLAQLQASAGNTLTDAANARSLAVQALSAVVAQVNASIPGGSPPTTPTTPTTSDTASTSSSGAGAFVAVAALVALAVGAAVLAHKRKKR